MVGVGFQQYNASWRNLRKIFTQEVLSPERMQYAEGLRASEMDYMVNSIFKDVTQNPKAPIEVNKYFWVLTINFISRMVLSKRYFSNNPEEESEEAAEFKYVINEQFFLLGSIFPADSFPFLERFDIGGLQKRTKTLLPRFQGILTKILTERREQRKQEGDAHVDVDMVDVLLTNQEKGEITELNIRGVVWVTILTCSFNPHFKSLHHLHTYTLTRLPLILTLPVPNLSHRMHSPEEQTLRSSQSSGLWRTS